MVASGVTAKGAEWKLKAEANKLAKAPKGLNGAAKGVENLAEDVGKPEKGSREQPREPRVQRKMLGRLLRPAMGSQVENMILQQIF